MLACLMLFTALSNGVYLHNVYLFFLLIFADVFVFMLILGLWLCCAVLGFLLI